MTSIYLLLSLPKTSNGLSALQPTLANPIDDGSASPRRKVPRLDTDSDSASASRSHTAQKPGAPIKIQIIGDDARKPLDFDSDYALVRRCIRVLLSIDSIDRLPATNESIYSACRSIVTVSNRGEGLYEELKMSLEQCLTHMAKALTSAPETGINWLSILVRHCQWFEKQIPFLQSLLTYLDQVYVVNNITKVRHIRELAFSMFRDRISENPIIAECMREGVKEWVNWERKLSLVHDDRQKISDLIQHLRTHKQYSAFEEFYLEYTRSFYTAESAERAEALKNEPEKFFKHAKMRIEEEEERSKAMLPVYSWNIVKKETEKALWDGRLDWIAGATLGPYMDAKNINTLAIMYSLFSRVDGVKILCAAFRKHVTVSVVEIVKDVAGDENMVQRLLDLKAFCDKTISTAFVDTQPVATEASQASTTLLLPKIPNQEFVYALGDAFTSGFKARRSKPAEMIAKYLDKAMRKGQGATTDADFEKLLDSALALYRYTDDKDVFRTFYHRSLAKRLLLSKSASDDFEAAMLKKLKQQYDPEFGMGEDMFKDLALSREAMREYHSRLSEESPGHKLTAIVLQRSAWPFSVNKATVDLPHGMQAELTAYGDYYKLKHSGHVLDWDHALGTATVLGYFNAGNKDLSVSLYQALILLLFNESTEISFKDIKEQTRMDDGELRRVLQSLACGKKKVLKKVPPGRDVDDGDVFKFNADFTDPRRLVHINSIQIKASVEESKRTNISIEGDRKHYLDAAIVRIMKARKEMTYEQLKAATIDAVKNHFVPLVDVIKKRIDSLVEADYLERSPKDRNVFLYVA